MKKHIIFITFVILLNIILMASFGESSSFGDDSFGSFSNEESFSSDQRIEKNYFQHDLLKKIITLSVFSILGILLYFKKRKYRKLLLFFSILIIGFYFGGFLCPLSTVQNIFLNYDTAYLILFLIPVVLSLILGRIFCGYVCVFGAIQELLHINKLRIIIPEKIIKKLNFIKYFLLIYLILRVLKTNDLILSGYTPFKSLFSLGGTSLSIILTIIVALISIVIYRPFCKYICPYGALLGIFSIKSKNKIITSKCIKCGLCDNKCGLNAIKKGVINKKECILCGDCVDGCKIINKK